MKNNSTIHFEINKLPNERFGVIKMFDKNNKLIGVGATNSKDVIKDDKEFVTDMYLHLLDMLIEAYAKQGHEKLEELLIKLDASLTLDGNIVF